MSRETCAAITSDAIRLECFLKSKRTVSSDMCFLVLSGLRAISRQHSQCAVTNAALLFLPSRMGCNSGEWDVMGDMYRHQLVWRASLKLTLCSFLTLILDGESLVIARFALSCKPAVLCNAWPGASLRFVWTASEPCRISNYRKKLHSPRATMSHSPGQGMRALGAQPLPCQRCCRKWKRGKTRIPRLEGAVADCHVRLFLRGE